MAALGFHPACLPSLRLLGQPLPLQLLPNSGADTSCWAVGSCDQRTEVAPAMDMPEVLKSLLEHSLPWPEKRTGRSIRGGLGAATGTVAGQAREGPHRGLPDFRPILSSRRAAVQSPREGCVYPANSRAAS